MSDCLKSPSVDVKIIIFTGSDSSDKKGDNLLYSDRQTNGHKYSEQIQRDRKTEKEKGSGPEADLERHACRQRTLGRWQ